MWTAFILALLGQAPPAAKPAPPPPPPRLAPDLAPPIRLEAAGKPIDTEVGHAAPFVGDFDGDGRRHLLVGQFGDGLLWIYRNTGSGHSPRLAAGVKFKNGVKDGRVPTG
jgi:hypothetical protein